MSLFASVVRNGVREFLEGVLAEPGDICHSYRPTKTGWIIPDGKTISKTDVTADYTGTEYEAIFDILLGVYPNVGTESWASGDKVFLPDHRGRVVACIDDAGGTAASRITVAGSGINGTVLGANGGFETHQLVEAELASHNHGTASSTTYTGGSAALHSQTTKKTSNWTRYSESVGSDEPHNNIPPSMFVNNFVKL